MLTAEYLRSRVHAALARRLHRARDRSRRGVLRLSRFALRGRSRLGAGHQSRRGAYGRAGGRCGLALSRVLSAGASSCRRSRGEVSGAREPLPWFPAEIIRDPDLARRLALRASALEAGARSARRGTALRRRRVDAARAARAERPAVAPHRRRRGARRSDEIPSRRRSARARHARRTRADASVSRRFTRRGFSRAKRVSRRTRGATRCVSCALARRVARGRFGDRRRGGERLHRPEPFHAAFQARRSACRPAAGARASPRTASEPQERTSASAGALRPILASKGGNLESITRTTVRRRIARIRRRRTRHHPDDGRRRALRRDLRHARHRESARARGTAS